MIISAGFTKALLIADNIELLSSQFHTCLVRPSPTTVTLKTISIRSIPLANHRRIEMVLGNSRESLLHPAPILVNMDFLVSTVLFAFVLYFQTGSNAIPNRISCPPSEIDNVVCFERASEQVKEKVNLKIFKR